MASLLGELGSRIPAKLHRDGLKTCNNLFRSLNLENQAGISFYLVHCTRIRH